MTIEQKARLDWRAWGHAWAMWTCCAHCHEFSYCRGKSREHMLCLDCFDLRKTTRRAR